MAIEHVIDSPLAHAVRAAKSQSAFGRAIGRSQPYVHGLLRDGKALPAEEAIRAESIDGVTRYALRPDIFGDAPAASETGVRQ